MSAQRAASSTPTLSHATPRRIPGSASSSETTYQLTRDRPRRASGTPSTRPPVASHDSSDATGVRSTRARVGPLPKNGPGNPLFPPLPSKLNKPRRSSQMCGLERMDSYEVQEEERDDGEEKGAGGDDDAQQAKQQGPEDDEQQGKGDGDHETMTSGLSDSDVDADAASPHQSEQEEEIKPVGSNAADNAEKPNAARDGTEETSDKVTESKPQVEDTDASSSAGKRSLRTRNTRDRSPHTDAKRLRDAGDGEPKDDAGGDMEVDEDSTAADTDRKKALPGDVKKAVQDEDDEEEEIVADEELVENPHVDQPGQVDANGDVTRCICGREADIDAMMIQCDHCNVWQHGACVGIWGDEEAPDEYFCELCKPGLHAPLRRYLRYRQKHRRVTVLPAFAKRLSTDPVPSSVGAFLTSRQGFAVPTPQDLEHHHYHSDRIKPSQSKRWTDPSVIKDESMSPPPQPLTHAAPVSHKAGAGKSHKAGAGKARSPSTSTTTLDTRRATAGAGYRAHSGMSDKSHQSEFKVPAVVPSAASTSGSTSGARSAAVTVGQPIIGRRPSNTSTSDTLASPIVGNSGSLGGAPSSKGKDAAALMGPHRKRSTMNSWDAVLEEAIAASLREAGEGTVGTRSRRGAGGVSQESPEDDDADKKAKRAASSSGAGWRGVKRTRPEEEEVEEGPDDVYVASGVRKGKKKKEELDASNKPKHPNQYTYRPKPATTASSTAAPTQPTPAPAAVEKPTRAAPAPHSPTKRQTPATGTESKAASRRFAAGGTRGGTPSSVSGSVAGQGAGGGNASNALSWNLPDHLAPFAYTVPAKPPSMLQIITPRPTNLIGKHKTDAVSAYEAALGNGETPTHLEPPTRVRYPTKRMTIGEMRKRVRNLLEYVGRVQGEEDKRAERAKLLELAVLPATASPTVEDSTRPEDVKADTPEEPKRDTELEQEAALTAEPQAMDVDTSPTEPAQVADADGQLGDDQPFTTAAITIVDPKSAAADAVMEETLEPVTTTQEDVPSAREKEKELETAAVERTQIALDAENKADGVPAGSVEPAPLPSVSPPAQPQTAPAATSNTAPIPAVEAPPSKSSQLLAELTSDLIKFQMMFEVGGSVFAAPANGNPGSGVTTGGADEE
ncbi:hypothetical protein QFC21_007225 [Naganishia friedmannii]|uniref:Uncharacterized protein n=1 Tax=Naganishia friedmannii TaxID=89922 RepID=A0ACC2UWH5_9TREE|nr:hypothetical protein QFC21_007225 [Naganishia friedmannii]